MAFTVPVFNLIADVWNDPFQVIGFPPDLADVPCQLYFPPKGTFAGDTFTGNDELGFYIRTPFGTPLSEQQIVEVPKGSAWYYQISGIAKVHEGFPNQYMVGYALLQSHPVAFPAGFFVDMESGDPIFLEDSLSFINTEDAP